MESVISVMNIPKDFKTKIVGHQLKIDLEQKLDKITHNLRVYFILYWRKGCSFYI